MIGLKRMWNKRVAERSFVEVLDKVYNVVKAMLEEVLRKAVRGEECFTYMIDWRNLGNLSKPFYALIVHSMLYVMLRQHGLRIVEKHNVAGKRRKTRLEICREV